MPPASLLFGLLAGAASAAARAGELAGGGCIVRGDGRDPNWQCSASRRHRWRDDDEALWTAALDAAMADPDG